MGDIRPERVATEEEWRGYFDELSNWGRWGKDDRAGTLNLIDEAKVASAARLVQAGRRVSCARVIEFGDRVPVLESRIPALHFFSWTGHRAPHTGGGGSMDWLAMPLHGLYATHIDAHAHAFWDGQMYNGRPASAVSAERGAQEGSLLPTENGVVTRGILLDVPRALGVPVLPAGFAIGAAELDKAAHDAGVVAAPGDLVMVRTGYGKLRAEGVVPSVDGESPDDLPHLPGLGVASLPWLRRHDVAMVGTDTATDSRPAPYSFNAPVHAVAICAMGMWVIDNLELEALAAACEHASRWEFMAVVAPLRLKNATGCPVNPIAVF